MIEMKFLFFLLGRIRADRAAKPRLVGGLAPAATKGVAHQAAPLPPGLSAKGFAAALLALVVGDAIAAPASMNVRPMRETPVPAGVLPRGSGGPPVTSPGRPHHDGAWRRGPHDSVRLCTKRGPCREPLARWIRGPGGPGSFEPRAVGEPPAAASSGSQPALHTDPGIGGADVVCTSSSPALPGRG